MLHPEAHGTEFGFAPLSLLGNLPDATTAHPFLCFSITLSHFQNVHIPLCRHTNPHMHTKGLYTDHPLVSSQNPGDSEHRLAREKGMKTERWKKQSNGGKVARCRTSFHTIKLCIFSSLLIDQLPQDISMPNQRPAASVYPALQERRLNQTHFSKEKLYLL